MEARGRRPAVLSSRKELLELDVSRHDAVLGVLRSWPIRLDFITCLHTGLNFNYAYI